MPAKCNYWGKLCFLPYHCPQNIVFLWKTVFLWNFWTFFSGIYVLYYIPKEYKFLPQYFVVTCFSIICQLITSAELSQANDTVRITIHQLFVGVNLQFHPQATEFDRFLSTDDKKQKEQK